MNSSVKGPAIIVEPTTSIVIEPKWTAIVDQQGSLLLQALDLKTKVINQSYSCYKKI